MEFELEVQPEELQDLFLRHEPRIVHFCGHGTGKQGLVLQNKMNFKPCYKLNFGKLELKQH